MILPLLLQMRRFPQEQPYSSEGRIRTPKLSCLLLHQTIQMSPWYDEILHHYHRSQTDQD